MAAETEVWGIFDNPGRLASAARHLRSEGYALTAYAPVMTAEIAEAVSETTSGVRWFSLAGGVAGGTAGMWLTIWSATSWGTITGGKPVVSLPPFLVIAFELTILFGAFATAVGFLLLSHLPGRRGTAGYEPCMSVDRFALRVTCPEELHETVATLLRQAGAERIHGPGEVGGSREDQEPVG
ncbi:MAG: DUF3341 domain-containing protein [Acidobacteriota bacterium]